MNQIMIESRVLHIWAKTYHLLPHLICHCLCSYQHQSWLCREVMELGEEMLERREDEDQEVEEDLRPLLRRGCR